MRGASNVGALLVAAALAWTTPGSAEEPTTRVVLNGVRMPCVFQRRRQLQGASGPLAGTTARLAGFNTLESFGPVHQWGAWHAYELYIMAKMATLNARRGSWHCDSDLSRDGYGRILWTCPDCRPPEQRPRPHDERRRPACSAPSTSPRSGARHRVAPRDVGPRRARVRAHVGALGGRGPEPRVRLRPQGERALRALRERAPPDHVPRVPDGLPRGERRRPRAQRCGRGTAPRDPVAQRAPRGFDTIHLGQLTWRWARTHELPTWLPADLRDAVSARLTELEREGAFGPVRTQPGVCFRYVLFHPPLRRVARDLPRPALRATTR